MIGWLKGTVIEHWKQGPKAGCLLACNGVGYEVQLTLRDQIALSGQELLTLWIHQIQREDGNTMFGFPKKQDREFFRALIAVNGIGPQMALALLQESTVRELLTAITERDIKTLCKAPGIGKRTAERLVIDLQNKVSNFNSNINQISTSETIPIKTGQLKPSNLNEVLTTLDALGYENFEINDAINAVAKDSNKMAAKAGIKALSPNDTDAWIKASIRWLSQDAA